MTETALYNDNYDAADGKTAIHFIVLFNEMKWRCRNMTTDMERAVVEICDETVGMLAQHHEKRSAECELGSCIDVALENLQEAIGKLQANLAKAA